MSDFPLLHLTTLDLSYATFNTIHDPSLYKHELKMEHLHDFKILVVDKKTQRLNEIFYQVEVNMDKLNAMPDNEKLNLVDKTFKQLLLQFNNYNFKRHYGIVELRNSRIHGPLDPTKRAGIGEIARLRIELERILLKQSTYVTGIQHIKPTKTQPGGNIVLARLPRGVSLFCRPVHLPQEHKALGEVVLFEQKCFMRLVRPPMTPGALLTSAVLEKAFKACLRESLPMIDFTLPENLRDFSMYPTYIREPKLIVAPEPVLVTSIVDVPDFKLPACLEGVSHQLILEHAVKLSKLAEDETRTLHERQEDSTEAFMLRRYVRQNTSVSINTLVPKEMRSMSV